jgi:hypothetical protein
LREVELILLRLRCEMRREIESYTAKQEVDAVTPEKGI